MARAEGMTDVLREEFRRRGMSVYAVSKATGIQMRSLARFLHGQQSIRLDKADLLAEFLGLRLRPLVVKSERRKGQRRGERG